jgi:GNAT superfamily N-acetyltransferase
MQFTLSCPVHSSYRVHQIAGMFDVPIAEKAERTFQFETPPIDDSWQIGCIVGLSGSGKSSIAKHLFPLAYAAGSERQWDSDKAVIDNFGELPIKTITNMLTVVGFSSPPSWIKPYSVLSNGEQFRCDLARALLDGRRLTADSSRGLVVFDEYTSVVDRNIAKIASAALVKAIKRDSQLPSAVCNLPSFVAVTCHYDILDWLEPDWVLDTATGKVQRYCTEGRLLRRPIIELDIFRCERRLWHRFKTHHYLSGDLAKNCRCYAAVLRRRQTADGSLQPDTSGAGAPLLPSVPVSFCALIPQQGVERWYRVSRIVTLPDYQGVGIGSKFLDALAELYVGQDYRFSMTASHPSVRSHCQRSERWKATNVMKTGSKRSKGRAVVSFEFTEPQS